MHKTFVKQLQKCDLFLGNCVSEAQFSSFIRAYCRIDCNGRADYIPGHLQDFDINSFPPGVPECILDAVRQYARTYSVILYEFRHWKNRSEKTVHGYVLTDDEHTVLLTWPTGPTVKSTWVINEMARDIAAKGART